MIDTQGDFAIFGLYLSTPFYDQLRLGIRMMLKHANDMCPYLTVFTLTLHGLDKDEAVSLLSEFQLKVDCEAFM